MNKQIIKSQSLKLFSIISKLLSAVILFAASFTASAATLTVTNTGNGGLGSLSGAISMANSNNQPDTINFNIPNSDPNCAARVCTITLTTSITGDQFVISNDTNNSANTLTITVSGSPTGIVIDGNNVRRAFFVNPLATLTLDKITIVNGSGAGATTNSNGYGGGIYNNGTLKLINSIVSNNTAQNYGGAIYNKYGAVTLTDSVVSGNNVNSGGGCGGGIDNEDGTITLISSTVSNNVTQGCGGGIYNSDAPFPPSTATLSLINSTISGNSARIGGAGIDNYKGKLTITNSTLSSNTGGQLNTGGGVENYAGMLIVTNSTISRNSSAIQGGGIYNISDTNNGTAQAFLRNSIIADNLAPNGQDIYNGGFNGAVSIFTSYGNNLIGNTNTGTAVTWNTSAGTADILNQSPRLAPLGNYGGQTQTHSLTSNSPAINAGNNCVLTANGCGDNNPAIPTDQRGSNRTGNVDIGAFETFLSYVASPPSGSQGQSYNYTIASDSGNFNYSITSGSLPSGLLLTTSFALNRLNFISAPSAAVAITGTPTQGGTFNFTITATDGVNSTSTNYSLTIVAPTAATAAVGGRVLTPDGRGVSKARVSLTNAAGETRTTITNAFGYYHFTDVPTGAIYIFSVSYKRYSSAPQVFTILEDVNDLNFVSTR